MSGALADPPSFAGEGAPRVRGERGDRAPYVPGLWADALRAARLIAADPHGCGGVVLRAGAGPVRDRWLDALRGFLPDDMPIRRMPGSIADDRLIGGLDLAATLAAGRPVAQSGLLAEADGGLVVAPMAERMPPGIAARLAAALDAGIVRVERDGLAHSRPARFGLILLDEGIGPEEGAAAALADRLAFHIDLRTVALCDLDPLPPVEDGPAGAEEFDPVDALSRTAAALGILSLRGPSLAVRVARLAARLDGRAAPTEADTIEAARLVLGPRATRLPVSDTPPDDAKAPAEEPDPESGPDQTPDRTPEAEEGGDPSRDERIVEAARAAIPPGLLAQLTEGGPRLRAPKAGRVGAATASARSGRPLGARPGNPRQGRLNLIETLRAAAPWQRLRRAERASKAGHSPAADHAPNPSHGVARLIVRPDDVRITRFKQRTETTTIFAVDASGSAALERLAEAKGAVELMLAEAYTRRDKVALVAFRGAGADLLLPPTRSLVRAKRGLSGLPGGGGTPLASGIDAATSLALGVRRGGGIPVVVLFTDGRANVSRAGEGGRVKAGDDSLSAARSLRDTGVRAILIDTASRPQDSARRLAAAMGARYLPLPYADAGAMSAAIRSASEPG